MAARALAAFLTPGAVCNSLRLRSTTPSFLLTSRMRALMGAPDFSVPSTCKGHKLLHNPFLLRLGDFYRPVRVGSPSLLLLS